MFGLLGGLNPRPPERDRQTGGLRKTCMDLPNKLKLGINEDKGVPVLTLLWLRAGT